jgi:photosystem II stability/assembly factor-like uncharacterized protein
MRLLPILLLVASAFAQSGPRIELTTTKESLRGVCAVSRQVAWASGTHGTYLRTTDAGRSWIPAQIPGAEAIDFRAVVAFSADEAFLMSAGPGDQSRIYHTSDGGQHWSLQFTNSIPKGFFDAMAFWDPKHGIVLGDPIPDTTGKLKFELLLTNDGGETWHPIPPSQLPEALPGEGAFAASNSSLAILHQSPAASHAAAANRADTARNVVIPSAARNLLPPDATFGPNDPSQPIEQPWKSGAPAPREALNDEGALAPETTTTPDPIWFATGGSSARVFHSPDHGQTWQVFPTPIIHGPDSAGIFSIAFRDPLHGVIAGGDYKHPNDDGPNLAFTSDGGQTWTLSTLHPLTYFSAVAYDQQVNQSALRLQAQQAAAIKAGKKVRARPTAPQRLFLVGEDFVFDFRPPADPRRIGGDRKGVAFNAVSPFPTGGALAVGPKGFIALIP